MESQITKIFGASKLELYNSLFFEARNVLENMSLNEDLNLYVLWAHNKASINAALTNVPEESRPLTNQDENEGQPSIVSQNGLDTNFDDVLNTNEEVARASTSDTPLQEPTQHLEYLRNEERNLDTVDVEMSFSHQIASNNSIDEIVEQDHVASTSNVLRTPITSEINTTQTKEIQPNNDHTPEKNTLSDALGTSVPKASA